MKSDNKHDRRGRDGARFVKAPTCDGCGKPSPKDYGTDDRVCGGSDGPGFYICTRKRCAAALERIEAEGGLEALRAHYTATRAAAEAKP